MYIQQENTQVLPVSDTASYNDHSSQRTPKRVGPVALPCRRYLTIIQLRPLLPKYMYRPISDVAIAPALGLLQGGPKMAPFLYTL